jgi:small-conductance mechanosensitive channel
MRTIRTLLIGVGGSAVWPAYLGLAAYAARQAPWSREVAFPASSALAIIAAAALAANLVRWLLGQGGWAETVLQTPPEVTRQVRRAALALVVVHAVFLVPYVLIARGLIVLSGRPVSAPSILRGLVLLYELCVLAVALRVLRRRSALMGWVGLSSARLGWLAQRQRLLSVAAVAGIAAVIVLDALGYTYSAHRLASGAAGSLVVAAACWGLYRVLLHAIDDHAWHWIKVGHAIAGRAETDASVMPDDLAGRLRRLSGYLATAVGLLLSTWVWDVDLALFRFLGEQSLWTLTGATKGGDGKELTEAVVVSVGDLAKGLAIVALCVAAWRHMSTFFAVVVFPRIPDDPGIRYAVVTLCRYAVLGLGLLSALSAVHLGLEKIGMVLAALGVGLGFGLQEIVSNFVCGIILLLERPIRVGDIVSVGGMTGKVDRINIRATTIINGDNQSIIVPNRAFITSDLVNWTLKDKIIRVLIRVKVAWGTDPDMVSELLLAIAREDADVLRNPVPGALMEEISDSALVFALSVHVPDPSLAGRVRHRLFRQIQMRFHETGIQIPLPTQELRLSSLDSGALRSHAARGDHRRADAPSLTPPVPWQSAPRPVPEPVEDCHRGVDE